MNLILSDSQWGLVTYDESLKPISFPIELLNKLLSISFGPGDDNISIPDAITFIQNTVTNKTIELNFGAGVPGYYMLLGW